MNEKMKDPMCVKKKVKIIPPEYSMENYIATFTPQKQLTPEHIFWSDDILKEMAKALKERANDPTQITAPTVYPPNTSAKLVPRALIKEVKEMKEIFEELEAEVDQNVMDRKCDEIQRKNLLIANENLIPDCLSKDVFYTATNYIQKDDHSEMIKRFSNLEIDHLNLQLKYQNLKERFGNNKSQPSQDAPEFDTVFEIKKMKASLQGKDNIIRKLQVQISQLKETRSEADHTLDFRALDFQIT
ncbi:hypothetical protein Tco_1460431 [Tanacetum coccineum]